MDYLDTLSRFAAGLRFGDLPAPVREHSGWILADTLAAIVAGSAEPELQRLAQLLQGSAGAGPASLPGLGLRTSVDTAALVNGTAGTFLEMDEGNRFSRGHPSVHVLPAVLALCEAGAARAAGAAAGHRDRPRAEALMSGLVAGYEVGSRLGAAAQLRGAMHPHGTWGTLGAAAGAANLMGADAATMRETLNVAASMSIATSKQTMLQGGLVRNTYAGLANRNGVLAAQLVGCGFTGETDGPGSLFGSIVSERFDRAAVVQGLGEEWHVLQNYFKLHSCCRYNHATLDALDQLAAAGALPAAGDIAEVSVHTYGLAAELVDPQPRNTLAAKFSVPFAVATRIVHGASGMAAFTWDAVRDERVRALAARVTVQEDPAMTRRLPQERPARVRIRDHQGRERVAEVAFNRGDDVAPYGHDELRAKFIDLCGRVWPRAHAQALLDATLALAHSAGQAALAGHAEGPEFDRWVALLRQPPA